MSPWSRSSVSPPRSGVLVEGIVVHECTVEEGRFRTACTSRASRKGPRSDMSNPSMTPSSSQMLQCNSPDPARAIIGCSAIIRQRIPVTNQVNSAAPLLVDNTAQADLSAAYNTRGAAYEKRREHELA